MTNQITVNVSALTDRVDTLQNSVTGLQLELQQIRNTIPTTLPEFTDPVPVNISNPTPPIDLTALLTELGAIKNILETQQIPVQPNEPTPMLTPVSLSNAAISLTGNWNVAAPDNLAAAIDSNNESSTGWGEITGGGSSAGIVFIAPTANKYYAEVEVGIRMASQWNGGDAEWAIAVGSDIVQVNVWGGRFRPTATEQRLVIPIWFSGTHIVSTLKDVGAGHPQMKVYGIRLWRYTPPTGE